MTCPGQARPLTTARRPPSSTTRTPVTRGEDDAGTGVRRDDGGANRGAGRKQDDACAGERLAAAADVEMIRVELRLAADDDAAARLARDHDVMRGERAAFRLHAVDAAV